MHPACPARWPMCSHAHGSVIMIVGLYDHSSCGLGFPTVFQPRCPYSCALGPIVLPATPLAAPLRRLSTLREHELHTPLQRISLPGYSRILPCQGIPRCYDGGRIPRQEGIGSLFCFAEAFAVSVAAEVGQANHVLDGALAAGIREYRNFLGICPGYGDDEYDYME